MEPGAITSSSPGTARVLLREADDVRRNWRRHAPETERSVQRGDAPEFLAPIQHATPAAPHRPVITVITAVLNGAAYLEQCIRSVAGQTYPHVEFIVIDGGSTDGSVDIIRRHAGSIAYWVSEPDRGI